MADSDTTTQDATTADSGTTGTTQTEASTDLGDAGKKALAEERAARKAAEKQAKEFGDRLKAIEDRDKTEAQKLADRAAAAEKTATDSQLELMRMRVGVKKGLPQELIDVLKGDTEAEMTAHAATLGDLVKNQTRPAGSVDQGPRGSAAAQGPAQEFASFLSKQLGQ